MNESAASWESVETLVPWKDNPRENSAAISKIADSIRRFGFGSPIVARSEDRMVIAGHTRLEAAKTLGLEKVPVRFLDLDPADAKMLALADNKLGEVADWEDAKLRAVLRELAEDDIDLGGLGWELDELEGFFDESNSTEPEVYTSKVESPIYEPTGDQPSEAELYDEGKSKELRSRVHQADLPDEVRDFLLAAAGRHTVFRYDRIAEYYAHAPADVQRLMEDSVLVIIDFDKAIEDGFVKLHKGLSDAYRRDFDEE